MNAPALNRTLAEQMNPMIGCSTEDTLDNACRVINDLSHLISSGDSPTENAYLLFGAVVAALRYESANLMPAGQKKNEGNYETHV